MPDPGVLLFPHAKTLIVWTDAALPVVGPNSYHVKYRDRGWYTAEKKNHFKRKEGKKEEWG